MWMGTTRIVGDDDHEDYDDDSVGDDTPPIGRHQLPKLPPSSVRYRGEDLQPGNTGQSSTVAEAKVDLVGTGPFVTPLGHTIPPQFGIKVRRVNHEPIMRLTGARVV